MYTFDVERFSLIWFSTTDHDFARQNTGKVIPGRWEQYKKDEKYWKH